MERAGAPLVFEVRAARSPSETGWALLRAPFELLARPGGGYLAEDELTRFAVVRRLGPIERPPGADGFRLGVAFMASSPRGEHELDFEAEEAAILRAVGDSRVDLLVEDTGDPEQLGQRLAEVAGCRRCMCPAMGTTNWRIRPGDPGMPVLMMENDVGDDRPTTAAELTRLLTVGPRLLMVSACLTATGADAAGPLSPADPDQSSPGPGAEGGASVTVAHSLATALVTAGAPAVIGWDGSVGDHAATQFAQRLYRDLAKRVARFTGEAGDPAAARDQYTALLPTMEEVSGPRHPDTLTARAYLAGFIGEAGDPAAARDQYTALLPTMEEVSGPRHPDTLTARANLAGFIGEAGDPAAARDQYTALLPSHRGGLRTQAPRHPHRPGVSRRLHRGGG